MRFIKPTLILPLLILTFLAAGCRTLPLDGSLPGGLVAEKVTVVDDGSPFDLSPDGKVAALSSSGLQLFHLPSRESLPLGERSPVRVAWSPLGYSLAAIYRADGNSSIVVYDQFGIPTSEEIIDAQLTDLGWLSENELIAGGFRVTGDKSGSSYKSLICRWKPGRAKPELADLRNTTLGPAAFAESKALLERGPMLQVVGQTGQILYLHPVDPPQSAPGYKLVIRDLNSGSEIEAAAAAFSSDGGRFSADGEKMLYGDGRGKTLLYDPWSEELLKSAFTPGNNPALSPEGRSWYADGVLFSSNGQSIELAPGSAARFSGDGSRLIVRAGSGLYLVSGLKRADDIMFVPAVLEKVRNLRQLRIKGQIKAKEYRESLEKVLNQ